MKCPPAVATSLLMFVAPLLVLAHRACRGEHAAERLGPSAAELQRRVALLQARVDWLERQTRDLEGERDEFLATLSHELRSPLHAVLGWIELLRLHPDDPAHQAHAIDIIERNARAELRVVGELLDMARLVTHRTQLAREPLRLQHVVADAVESVRTLATAKRLDLHIERASDVEISGDRTYLRQAIDHLLDNAVKFTDPGGRITVSVERDDDHATLVVADSGIGIARDMLPMVFDRFRQGERGLTRRYGGLGLGLTIVKHVIALHRGTVEVYSDGPGRGTRFTVKLPRRSTGSTDERCDGCPPAPTA